MTGEGKVDGSPPQVPMDESVRDHLKEIEREETPERLLELARELQRLLREDGKTAE
jgi:hypothetical protein